MVYMSGRDEERNAPALRELYFYSLCEKAPGAAACVFYHRLFAFLPQRSLGGGGVLGGSLCV